MRIIRYITVNYQLDPRPSVRCPVDGALDEDWCSVVSDAVAMTDEDVMPIEGIDSAMTGSFIFLFVAFKEKITTTIAHIDTFAVEIWAFYILTAAYSHAIIAL